ncbi:homoserine kinase type II [Streptosporangium becharense]|uniref:Homoserine kinase type II n=1 Tax=Streptosporangium becharense TaxID=1816182 RepID=A0A7W9IB54_9ACTN|nr:phosphotransferase [Streptosporangium becharense]MBB2910614.1 homoserine kinase type II [Streptosporangium becharense]MBB5817310.1 homoserine kinase type II [Streptosporangium becharense]
MTAGRPAARRTPETDVALLMAAYGLDVLRARPLAGGVENSHVRVETQAGPVVLTVLRKRSPESARQYARLLRHLFLTGAPVPRIHASRDGDWVTSHLGSPAIVCDFVEGRTLPRLPPPGLVEQAGMLLGRVHRTAAGFRSPLRPHLRLGDAEADLLESLPDGAFSRWATATLRATRYAMEHPGPRVPVHADLFPDNIILKDDGTLVFIDWEDGSLDVPEVDVGMAVLGLCCRRSLSVRRARCLLRGYRAGREAEPDTRLIRDAARHAAVIVALRRCLWRREGRLPADPLRSPAVMHGIERSVTERWRQVEP